MNAKYLDNSPMINCLFVVHPFGSLAWKKKFRMQGLFMFRMKWKLGNGNKIRFWDPWLLDSPLSHSYFKNLMRPTQLFFGEYISDYSSLERFTSLFPLVPGATYFG